MAEPDDVVGEPDDGPLAVDTSIREALAAVNFDLGHSLYAWFLNDLAGEGLRRVGGMLASGSVFVRVRQRHPRADVFAPDHWSAADRADLTGEVVHRAVQRFHDPGMVGHDWDPAKGATMMTYFLGLCLDEFPHVFRGWRERPTRLGPSHRDPIASLITDVHFHQLLAELPEKQRSAIQLHTIGYTDEAVAQRLGVTLAAAEALIARARTDLRQRLRGGGGNGFPHA